MYGLSAALGKAGAAVGTQVFKPILAALEDRTGDVLKAQGYIFIIGSCISILGGILVVLFVSIYPSTCHLFANQPRKQLGASNE